VPPEERVLAHRERSWAAQLPDVDPALLRWTAAAATIAGGDTEGDADALLALLPALAGADARALRGRLARWWADAVPGARLLNPLQPDRLGEHLAALTLTGMQDAAPGLLDGLLTLPSDRQVGATLDLLARTHAGHPQLAQLTDEAVLRNFFRLARRATGSPGAGHGGQGGAPAADALLRLIAPSVVQRLVPGDDVPADRRERERSVSIACTHLGELATVAGRDGEAHALLDAALRIDQALAASAAGEVQYRREVAADQLRLAHLHAAAGRASLAESGYRRALDTLRELAEQDADNPAHWRQMVTAHTRLADLDRDGERVALADAGYRRAVDAVQALVTLDPENASYRRELAAAYVRLAELDAAAGWVAQAESGYRRATELNEWLVRHDPGNADDRRRLEADRLKLTTFAGDRTDNDDGRP
jgi:tetratricopeptide (TPR) repeat protein